MSSVEKFVDLLITTTSLLDAAIQQSTDPVFELSSAGTVIHLNQAAANLFRVSPSRIVGKAFSRLLRDEPYATDQINELLAHEQRRSWQAEFICAPGETSDPQQVTAVSLSSGLVGGSLRLLVWCNAIEAPPNTTRPALAKSVIPQDRRLYGRDLDTLRKKLDLSVVHLAQIIGVSPITWYQWRNSPNEPIKSRTAELHLRLLDLFPSATQVLAQPSDLKHVLETQREEKVTNTELALLLGVDRRTGYSWAQGGAVSEQVSGLTATLLRVLLEMPPSTWQQYRALIEQQADLEKTDIQANRGWSKRYSKTESETKKPAPLSGKA